MTRRLFVDVDTQNDFLNSPKLHVDPSIINHITKLVGYAIKERIPLVGSLDTHSQDIWFTNQFKNPEQIHCVAGTWGQLKISDTLPARSIILPNLQIPLDALANEFVQGYYFEKSEGTLFNNPSSPLWFKKTFIDPGFEEAWEIVVFGVDVKTTVQKFFDYCDFRPCSEEESEIKFEVKVVEDAIFNTKKAFIDSDKELMESLGAKFVKASEFIGEDKKPRKK